MRPLPHIVSALLLAAAACGDRGAGNATSSEPGAPFLGPAAPFLGPAEKAPVRAEPPPVPNVLPPVAPIAAIPSDDASRRRDLWTSTKFRCRAISTTRLRTCRLQPSAAGWSITFPIADLTCEEVVFDGVGDPAELRGCASTWLRVPKTISLKRSRDGQTWSGSHSGWRWPGDGEAYCCPGVWLEAPDALR